MLGLALLGLAAGCVGDEERAETPPTPPELTIPRTEPEPEPSPPAPTQPQREDPATAPAPPGEGDGSTPAPRRQSRPDSPENDTPPPAGSPAERFERECEQNPAACG